MKTPGKDSHPRISATCLTPILFVRDFRQAVEYYTGKLLFGLKWKWGRPPSFGCVGLDRVEIFFCLRGQGNPGSWLSLFMEDVDDYHDRIKMRGAVIVSPPENMPWGCREMLVRDPNRHIIRFSQPIPMREPKLSIKRVPVSARLERRLAGLLKDLSAHKEMSVGEVLEEMLLHSFERVTGGGTASPHTERTLSHIQALKKKHRIDYDVHANYRFSEKRRSSTAPRARNR